MKNSGVSFFFLENGRKNFKLNLVLVLVLVLKSKSSLISLSSFSNRTGTSVDDRKARGKD